MSTHNKKRRPDDIKPTNGKKEKFEVPSSPKMSQQLFRGVLDIHKHRYFRRIFVALICIHIAIIFLVSEWKLKAPQFVKAILYMASTVWPFPTFQMSIFTTDAAEIDAVNIIFKIFEILIILLYAIDLLPKIFVWRAPIIWKLTNIFVVTIMVVQVSLTIIGYLESGENIERLKWRVCSISLSFLLLCEIFSIREQRTLRMLEKSTQQQLLRRDSECNLEGFRKYLREKEEELKSYKSYSWAEIVKHDVKGDCWIVIHGKIYDVSKFIATHPGGSQIYDGAGGDCTSMFESLHPTYLTNAGVPQEMCIGEVSDYTSFYSWEGNFYKTIRSKVEKLVPQKQRRYHWGFFLKAFCIVPLYFLALYGYIFHTSVPIAILFGLIGSQMGVNIMHDGNHGSITDNKYINWLGGICLDLTFSTSIVYKRSHNFGHHSCVNHFELDRAYDTTYPLFRMYSAQPKLWFHKYQHFYMPCIYGMINFGDLFGTFDELYWMSNYPTRRGYLSKTAFLTHALVKFSWLILCVIVPSYNLGWYNFFPAWTAYMVAMSHGYAWFFAVNHWTTEAQQVDNNTIAKTNWGVLQVENSSNFALGSTFWTNLAGGLNFQIEHHLFPSYNHMVLPKVSKIVQETCKEYGVRYFSFKSFWEALRSHYEFLRHFAITD